MAYGRRIIHGENSQHGNIEYRYAVFKEKVLKGVCRIDGEQHKILKGAHDKYARFKENATESVHNINIHYSKTGNRNDLNEHLTCRQFNEGRRDNA